MKLSVFLGPGVATRETLAPTEVLEDEFRATATYLGAHPGAVNGHDPSHVFTVDALYADATPDVLVIPGSFGALELAADRTVVGWIGDLIAGGTVVLAISTGSLPVAATGFLVGRPVAGHWLCNEHLERLGCVPSPYPMETRGRVVTTSGTAAALRGASYVADLARWGPVGDHSTLASVPR